MKQIVLLLLFSVLISIILLSGCDNKMRYVYVTQTLEGTNQTVTTTLPAITITKNAGETYITTVTTTTIYTKTIDNIVTTQTTNSDDIILIDINQLIDEYNENEVAADLKYKNKRLQITDTIDSITSSSSGPLINFSTRLVWTVYCYFENTYASQIAQFYTGQIITIQGTCMGKGYLGVILNDCILISQ